jgi:hypothetical protein
VVAPGFIDTHFHWTRPIGYIPGATARAMFEVQRVGANYGRPTSVHLRYTPGTVTTEANGAQEILANAVALDAPAIINHFNNPGWELVQELLVRFRAHGHNVWGEIYPYAAGQTTINAAYAAGTRPTTGIPYVIVNGPSWSGILSS